MIDRTSSETTGNYRECHSAMSRPSYCHLFDFQPPEVILEHRWLVINDHKLLIYELQVRNYSSFVYFKFCMTFEKTLLFRHDNECMIKISNILNMWHYKDVHTYVYNCLLIVKIKLLISVHIIIFFVIPYNMNMSLMGTGHNFRE